MAGWPGGHTMSVLHVMADGFPANHLTLDYHVRLTPVVSMPLSTGPPVSPRVAIREQQGQAQLRRAVEEIFAALQRSPAGEQVIFFAQDRLFLRTVKDLLVHPDRLDDADGTLAPLETGGMVLADNHPQPVGQLAVDDRDREPGAVGGLRGRGVGERQKTSDREEHAHEKGLYHTVFRRIDVLVGSLGPRT